LLLLGSVLHLLLLYAIQAATAHSCVVRDLHMDGPLANLHEARGKRWIAVPIDITAI